MGPLKSYLELQAPALVLDVHKVSAEGRYSCVVDVATQILNPAPVVCLLGSFEMSLTLLLRCYSNSAKLDQIGVTVSTEYASYVCIHFN